ncbi:hypothetical protein ACH5RR_015621 [Cinchona calisaya]|uniref:Uncharacterized protein n=1 Tax=Cinchona calisaya TaxID=153742 RepID=A0ABD2ZWC4_9GENT
MENNGRMCCESIVEELWEHSIIARQMSEGGKKKENHDNKKRNGTALFSTPQLIYLPLKIDTFTATINRPNVATVCVRVGEDEDGFRQYVEYENLPSYCSHCLRVGHSKSESLATNSNGKKPPPDGENHEKDEIPSYSEVRILKIVVEGNHVVPVSGPIIGGHGVLDVPMGYIHEVGFPTHIPTHYLPSPKQKNGVSLHDHQACLRPPRVSMQQIIEAKIDGMLSTRLRFFGRLENGKELLISYANLGRCSMLNLQLRTVRNLLR